MPPRFRTAHPGHRGAFLQQPKKRAMGAGRELYARHRDEHEIAVEIALNPIETPHGPFVLSTIVDVAARKQTEPALRESEERYKRLAEELAAADRSASRCSRTSSATRSRRCDTPSICSQRRGPRSR